MRKIETPARKREIHSIGRNQEQVDATLVRLEFKQFRWSFLQGSIFSCIMTQKVYPDTLLYILKKLLILYWGTADESCCESFYLYTFYERKTEDILGM